MAGIVNYFHRETGIVDDFFWRSSIEDIRLILNVSGNPHRHTAFDYGGDVSFDPTIQRGDKVTYLRIDSTCGIWVRQEDIDAKLVHRSLRRVRKSRLLLDSLNRKREDLETESAIAAEISKNSEIPVRSRQIGELEPVNNQPATEASLFLSYSNKNVMLARQLFHELKDDAKVDVWFDMNQSAEPPQHILEIEKWLRSAIFRCRGLILLFSRAASESNWGSREIEWAQEAIKSESDFHVVVLRLDDIAVPFRASSDVSIVDCFGLHRGVGIPEELYARIYGRIGRQKDTENEDCSSVLVADSSGYLIGDFESDSGTALEFSWKIEANSRVVWQLKYDDGQEQKTILGGGLEQPADLGIQPGDLIAVYQCRSRHGIRFGRSFKLPMRSKELHLSPDVVLDNYYDVTFTSCTGLNYKSRGTRITPMGEDAFGRLLSSVECECEDGEIRRIEDLLFYGVADDRSEKDLGRRAFIANKRLLTEN